MAEVKPHPNPVLPEFFPELPAFQVHFRKDAVPVLKNAYLRIEGPIELDKISQEYVETAAKGLSYQNIQEVIANLPAQISLSELSGDACKFLAKLCDSADYINVAQIVEKLVLDINWEANSSDLNFLLTQLVERGFGQKVLESLPNPLNLENLKTGRLLIVLLEHGFKEEIMARLAKVINLNLIVDFGGSFLFLRFLFKKVDQDNLLKRDLFERFSLILDLAEISKSLGGFLAFLVSQGFGQDLVDQLPAQINLETLSEGGNLLLDVLCIQGFHQAVLVKLPSLIDVEKVSGGVGNFLVSLAKNKLTSLEIFMRLPKTITPHQCSPAMGYILDYLVSNGFGEQLFNKLSSSIDINVIDDGIAYFLIDLVKLSNRYLYLIGKKLKFPIEISSLSGGADYLLAILIKHGLAADIIENLATPIDLTSLEDGKEYDALNTLVDLGYDEILVKKLPNSIDANKLSVGSGEFLNSLIFLDYGELVEDKILASISLESIANHRAKNLIDDLFKAGLGEKIKQKIKPQLQELDILRTGFNISTSELPQEKAGPSLEQMIAGFPLDWQSRKSKLGWSKFQLNKTGTFSTAWIRFNPKNLESTRIIFLTGMIGEASLATYQKAIELMPTGVSRAFYPELTPEGTNLDHFYADGFREVFTGPALFSLDLEKLPEKITQNINAQHQFILWTLLFNGIEHGHAHTRNFNVRFLLKDKQGNKKLFFDVNEALERAAQEKQTFIPIVTLRDWDAGKSS